jgi:hypothetical protein
MGSLLRDVAGEMLVAMGATLFVLVPMEMGIAVMEPSEEYGR